MGGGGGSRYHGGGYNGGGHRAYRYTTRRAPARTAVSKARYRAPARPATVTPLPPPPNPYQTCAYCAFLPIIPILIGVAVGAGSYAVGQRIKGEPIDPWQLVLDGILGGASAGLGGLASKILIRILFGGIKAAQRTRPKAITPKHSIAKGDASPEGARILARIDSKGSPFPNYKGGKTWDNEDRETKDPILPKKTANGDSITYREWDLLPNQKGVNRGTRRLVTGSDGSAYETSDHYGDFVKIR